MVDIVISVASKAAEYLVDPICRQLSYLFKYRPNVEDLSQQMEKLGYERERVQILVEEAYRQGDQIFTEVTAWLEDAQGIIQKKVDFIKDVEQASKSCFYLKSRYHLSKKAKKQAVAIEAKLQQAHDFGDRVSHSPPPPPLVASACSKSYEAFPSRQSIYNQIMEALRNEETGTVGVCGMGGIGKTTLALQVAKQAEKEKLFDKVVMASSISQTPKIPEIQNAIAKTLGLTFKEGDDRADRLSNSLKNQKKVLVILDDIWDKLDLEKIGIPYGDDHKGCKLLFTSRERKVLEKEMEAQRVFHLRHLDDEEAWSLFKRTAGDSVELPEIISIAQNIVTKCEGLPVAIVTIAKALGGEKLHVWKNALEELESAVPTNVDGVSEKVYSCLELSYKHLKGDEVKSIFLLCSLHEGGRISMDSLLHHAMGLNLFQGLNSWEKATNRLITLVQKLKDSNLLFDIKDKVDHEYESVFFDKEVARMHDVVRDVARSIASKDAHQYVVRDAGELREWEMAGEGRNYRRIFFKCREDMDELPQRLVCPQLELFLLDNLSSEKLRIPDAFFQDAKELTVLDLRRVSLRLGSLSKLRTLCLTECEVENIQAIGEMKRLQVISLAGCESIADLRNCKRLSLIPQNLISSLSRLECLSLKGCYIEWERDGAETEESNMNACLSEIKGLTHLKILEVEVSDPSLLSEDGLLFDVLNLTRYSINIGRVTYFIDNWILGQFSGILRIADVQVHVLQSCFSKLLKTCQCLALQGVNDIKDVVCELDKSGFLQLEYLRIGKCPNIQYILGSGASMEWVPPPNTFGMLNELSLHTLSSLEAVFYFRGSAPIPMDSFRNLRDLFLDDCRGLKYVVSLPAHHGRNELPFFPQLQKLELRDLPGLKSFYSTATTEGNQESITTLFNQQEAFPNLEDAELVGLAGIVEIWRGQFSLMVSFSKLSRLFIVECPNISVVIPRNMVQALHNLECLWVRSCDGVKEIIQLVLDEEEEEEPRDHEEIIDFPRLRVLELWNLPQLKSFCSAGHKSLRFQSLEEVDVEDCPNMEFFCRGGVDAPRLRPEGMGYSMRQYWERDLNTTIQKMFVEYSKPVEE